MLDSCQASGGASRPPFRDTNPDHSEYTECENGSGATYNVHRLIESH